MNQTLSCLDPAAVATQGKVGRSVEGITQTLTTFPNISITPQGATWELSTRLKFVFAGKSRQNKPLVECKSPSPL